MNDYHSKSAYAILPLLARATLRFVARRRSRDRYRVWHPIALFWRQKRRGSEKVYAKHATSTAAGVVWLPQFHLHFMPRAIERSGHNAVPRLPLTTANVHTRVVMVYQRTIAQFRMGILVPHREPHIGSILAQRNAARDWGIPAEVVVPHAVQTLRPRVHLPISWIANHTRRSASNVSHRHALGDSGTLVRVVPPHTSSALWPRAQAGELWRADHSQYSNLGRTHPRVRLSTGPYAQEPRRLKRESYVSRVRSTLAGDAVLALPQTAGDSSVNFDHSLGLMWRRAGASATGIAGNQLHAEPYAQVQESVGRSVPRQEVAAGTTHPIGHGPMAAALKFDSAMIDRLVDDVIRRVERRERIERARRGL